MRCHFERQNIQRVCTCVQCDVWGITDQEQNMLALFYGPEMMSGPKPDVIKTFDVIQCTIDDAMEPTWLCTWMLFQDHEVFLKQMLNLILNF